MFKLQKKNREADNLLLQTPYQVRNLSIANKKKRALHSSNK